jgi:hypothetical protein
VPVINGVSYQRAQPCLDLAAQMKVAGIRNLGIDGDLAHQDGCGDHVPWECTGHFHWVTAIDIGWGGTINGVRLSPALLRTYLLPRLRAHTWEFYQVKYIITGNKLNDTRPPYNLKDQYGPDGTDHMHISFLNSAVHARCTIIQDFVAWVQAGRPNPVTFDPRAAAKGESTVGATTLDDGTPLYAAIGSDSKIYKSFTPTAATGAYALVGNSTWLPGVDVVAEGKGAVFAVRDEDRSIWLVFVDDIRSGAGYRAVRLGGTGAGTPAIARLAPGRYGILVKGTDTKGTLYAGIYDKSRPAGQEFMGFSPTKGYAR